MRRVTWLTAVVMSLVIFLIGCGKKSEADVVHDLEKMIDSVNSYAAEGSMVLHSGEQPQEYELSVWYQKPDFYRIAITNKQKDVTQIVLKNEEGVFVLTPHLQKSFRFKSEWPNNHGQIYLYQTLVRSIVDDMERAVTTEGESYVFEVKANYQNVTLPRQKIWLKQQGYAPQHVELLDENDKPIVTVDFRSFEFDKKFESGSFEMDWNLTSWNISSLPAMSQLPASGEIIEETAADNGPFGVIYPAYEPAGVELTDVQDVQLGKTDAVLLRYAGGDYSYSILESRPQSESVFIHESTILDLGYTMGVLSGSEGELQALVWLSEGIEFRLTADGLPTEEMVKIAQSVEGQIGK